MKSYTKAGDVTLQ